jgi:hypothetical protein
VCERGRGSGMASVGEREEVRWEGDVRLSERERVVDK